MNEVSKIGGYVATDGNEVASLELDVAGLMSTSSPQEVVERDKKVLTMATGMGCRLPAPFMTLSFQCLLVVPELKISDKGLFDSSEMRFVDLVID